MKPWRAEQWCCRDRPSFPPPQNGYKAGIMPTPKYARREHERRFLVRTPPAEITGAAYVRITDRYIDASRLRLRAMRPSADGATMFKFCKKYGSDDAMSEPIVNIYLSKAEHTLLAALPGRTIVKRRYHVDWDGLRHAVDIYEGELSGLVIGEIEAPSVAALQSCAVPPWATAEITGDAWFEGGNLATITAQQLKSRLATP
jgi:CYTH domain-containing protein